MMGIVINFDKLTLEELAEAPQFLPEPELVPIVPVPSDAPRLNFVHHRYGSPAEMWRYLNAEGNLIGYIARFEFLREDQTKGKIFYPLTYCKTENGFSWRAVGFPSPHTLFNLPEILNRKDDFVLVVQGEKTAEAAKQLFPSAVVTTNPYGIASVHNADWTVLKNRKVVISANNDLARNEFISSAANAMYKAGAVEVRILPPEKLGQYKWVDGSKLEQIDVPDGWDMKNALDDGWNAESAQKEVGPFELLEMIPRPLVYDHSGKPKFRMTSYGVEALVEKFESKTGELISSQWKWICSPVELKAETRDEKSESWSKLFEITNRDGDRSEVLIPCELLAGEGAAYREILLNCGVEIGTTKQQRDFMNEFISSVKTDERVRCVDHVGWHGNNFVLSTRVIKASDQDEKIMFQGRDNSRVGALAGSLLKWQHRIGRLTIGNSRLVLAISAALSAPLLKFLDAESGGFHFVGNSSIGKTTALVVAGSVWGGGGVDGYQKSWRATSNGLESVAAAHCDALLCLDEIGQVKASEIGPCVYMLANGVGKIRSSKTGTTRPALVWRLILLSSGEVTLENKILEEGRGQNVNAGQLVRIINLDADAGKGLGMFENLHGYASAEEFSRALKAGANENYGYVASAFIKHFVQDRETALTMLKADIDDFVRTCCPTHDVDGQVLRVARKFGVAAAAGELAVKFGILPWQKGEAMAAAEACFASWLSDRGSAGSMETEQAIRKIRLFIQNHGGTRFGEASDEGHSMVGVHNRVGFIHTDKNKQKSYCFFLESWTQEICAGLNPSFVAKTLLRKGYLEVDPGRLNKTIRVNRQTMRVYMVKESILFDDPEPAPANSSLMFNSAGPMASLQEKLEDI